jgi:hypothetical protein
MNGGQGENDAEENSEDKDRNQYAGAAVSEIDIR